jgi:hypothetical protein
VTRGEGKQEVDGGGDGRVAARGEALCRWQKREVEEQRGFRGRRREGKGPMDLCAKLKDLRGLAVKQKFPLI